MKIEQIYTGCLAQGAYYIESDGEAVVIDPLREVYPYIQKAERNKAKIKYVFETHFHADFVSGHLDLAGIDHDDEIAGINMWSIRGFMLTAKHTGNLRCQASDRLPIGIDDIPVPLHLACFGGVGAQCFFDLRTHG